MKSLGKQDNYKQLRNYFAFVLMFFTVFTGSNVDSIAGDSYLSGSLKAYALKAGKIVPLDETTQKPSDIERNKRKADNKEISTSADVLQQLNLFVLTLSAIAIFIGNACHNELLKRNNVWLGHVF